MKTIICFIYSNFSWHRQYNSVTPNEIIILGQIVITLPWKFWQCMMWFDWSKWIMWKMKKISYPKFIIHLLLIYYGFTRTKICSTCYSHMSVVANYFHICEGYYRLHGWLAWFMVIWKLVPIILQKCVTFSTSNLTTDLKPEVFYGDCIRRCCFIFPPKSFQNLSQNCKFLLCLLLSVFQSSIITNAPSYFLTN